MARAELRDFPEVPAYIVVAGVRRAAHDRTKLPCRLTPITRLSGNRKKPPVQNRIVDGVLVRLSWLFCPLSRTNPPVWTD